MQMEKSVNGTVETMSARRDSVRAPSLDPPRAATQKPYPSNHTSNQSFPAIAQETWRQMSARLRAQEACVCFAIPYIPLQDNRIQGRRAFPQATAEEPRYSPLRMLIRTTTALAAAAAEPQGMQDMDGRVGRWWLGFNGLWV